MNYQAWMFWLVVAQFIVSCATAIYARNSRRRAATNERITGVETEMRRLTENHEKRLTVIENEMRHLPTKDDLNHMAGEVFGKIDDVRKDLSEVIGGLKATQRQFMLINEHLLRGGKE